MTKEHYRLFVASPGDVAAERDAVEEVVKNFNLHNDKGMHIDVIRWEDHATPNWGRAQKVIFDNTNFENTDVFVGIFWSRMGTASGAINPKTGEEYISGTMEEIQKALDLLDAGTLARFMLYFCTRPISETKSAALKQALQVAEFREELDKNKNLLYRTFDTTDKFKLALSQDIETVARDIKEIRDHAETNQRQHSETPANPEATESNLGPYVAKLCNRDLQNYDFHSFFVKKREECPGRPQFFLVSGEENQAHKSLVERFKVTHLKNHVDSNPQWYSGVIIHKDVSWPEEGSFAERCGMLKLKLFHKFAPAYNSTDFTATAFSKLPCFSHNPLVVIEHDLSSSCCDIDNHKLLNWYVKEYWTALSSEDTTTRFFIFLNLIYENEPKVNWWKKTLKKSLASREVIFTQLKDHFNPSDSTCPGIAFRELRSVKLRDVKKWLGDHKIFGNPLKQNALCLAIFRVDNQIASEKPMLEIEAKLEEIVAEYTRMREGIL